MRWAIVALWLGGCWQDQLVGYACPESGCRDLEPLPPPIGECAAAIATPQEEVRSEAELCWVYSLDIEGPQDEPIFITDVAVSLTQFTHHLDVRLVSREELDPERYPDGPLQDCNALWNGIIAEPLLATEDSTVPWSFADAPLMTTPSHRVMINQHYINSSVDGTGVAEVGVTLNVYCVREPPPVVTQAFAFVRREREPLLIGVGEEATVSASCNFEQDVRLRRLFRRTHQIEEFRASLLRDMMHEPLWAPDVAGPCDTQQFDPWRCEFADPVLVSHAEPLEWSCTYRNQATRGDMPIVVGAGTDACSLMGHYSLATGGIDEELDSCAR